MPRSEFRRTLFLAALVLLVAACATAPSGPRSEPAAHAEALHREGAYRAAAEAFLEAAEGSRRDRDRLRLRAAEAFREEADLDAARRALQTLSPRRLSDDERVRLALLEAELALAENAPERAAERLRLEPTEVGAEHRARWFELRGRAAQAHDGYRAAAEFARLDALLVGAERRDNALRVRDLLDALDDQRLRVEAEALPGRDPLQPFLARTLSQRGLALPAHFRAVRPDRTSRPDGIPGARRIALLLPQSGPLRAAAGSVRDGFLAARFAHGDGAAEVMLVDSGETPEQAVAGYRAAVAAGVDWVVGPLARDSVAMLFAERELPVPVLALNRSGAPLPPGHLSFALSPEDEAIAIARLLQQRGLRRVVAVSGGDDLAARTVQAFSARHVQGGGELLAMAQLPVSGVDYQPAIRAALASAGLPTSAPTDLTIAHDPGFDAVFMAVRPGQARLLVAQLKLFGLLGMPMFGTSMLHAAEIGGAPLDRDLDGVEFTEAAWLVERRAGLPDRERTAVELDSARGGAARLFAFGLDAWKLLHAQHALIGADLPLPAATGDLSIDALGEARSLPVIARFRGGRAQALAAGGLRPE